MEIKNEKLQKIGKILIPVINSQKPSQISLDVNNLYGLLRE